MSLSCVFVKFVLFGERLRSLIPQSDSFYSFNSLLKQKNMIVLDNKRPFEM